MKRRKLWKAMTAVSVFGICFSFAGMSLAAWQITGSTDNILTMSSYKNQIVEEYEEPGHVDPSGEVSKTVNVSNTGNVDTIIRVSLKRQFGTERSDGSFIEDKMLDPEMILLNLNTTWWMEKDGYYYYREVLKAGETTKEPLMTSYRLSEKAGNEYKVKDARILVNMESVQAQGNAVSIWHTTYKELGITVPEQSQSKDTSVTYRGRERGFDIDVSKTDLFANFKDLLPGCGRSQKIVLKNDSGEAAEIFLRAEAADQEKMSEEQLNRVNQLLQKYALIELRVGDRVLYSGSVSGNLTGGGSTMKEDISLGLYPAGQTGAITVRLSLDPEMDNQFLSLTGKVRWVFTVRGSESGDGGSGAIYPAKTGVAGRMGMWCGIFLLCSMLSVLGFAGMRRQQKRENRGA